MSGEEFAQFRDLIRQSFAVHYSEMDKSAEGEANEPDCALMQEIAPKTSAAAESHDRPASSSQPGSAQRAPPTPDKDTCLANRQSPMTQTIMPNLDGE